MQLVQEGAGVAVGHMQGTIDAGGGDFVAAVAAEVAPEVPVTVLLSRTRRPREKVAGSIGIWRYSLEEDKETDTPQVEAGWPLPKGSSLSLGAAVEGWDHG